MSTNAGSIESGFWMLHHDHLEAFLARTDLSWEVARVYLALADLTHGYSKDRDTVSLGQIAERAGMFTLKADGTKLPDCPHVVRALKRLKTLGMYSDVPGRGQSVIRWVVWPPPSMQTIASAGNTATAGSSTTADVGNGTTANATAGAGRHQDTKKSKKQKKLSPADASPPDPRVKSFLDFFENAYVEALGKPYIVNFAKDGATIKRLLRSLDGKCADPLADLQRAARNMLADSWARDRADIGLLAGKINSWLPRADRYSLSATTTAQIAESHPRLDPQNSP